MNERLRALELQGFRLRPAFITDRNRFKSADDLYKEALVSDFRVLGAGTGVAEQMEGKDSGVIAGGPVVLQINFFCDISLRNDEREVLTSEKRTAKLIMTDDGANNIFGIEKQRIESLTELTKPGAKIVLKNPPFRRGVLLLDSTNALVLGGCVGELVDLKEKKIKEIERRKWYAQHRTHYTHIYNHDFTNC